MVCRESGIDVVHCDLRGRTSRIDRGDEQQWHMSGERVVMMLLMLSGKSTVPCGACQSGETSYGESRTVAVCGGQCGFGMTSISGSSYGSRG